MGRPAASCALILSWKTCRAAASAFGCVRAFFICHPELAKRLPDRLGADPEPRGALILVSVGLVSVGMLGHVARQSIRIDLADLATLIALRGKPPAPSFQRRNPHRKPLGGLIECQALLPPYAQDMAAKINGISSYGLDYRQGGWYTFK